MSGWLFRTATWRGVSPSAVGRLNPVSMGRALKRCIPVRRGQVRIEVATIQQEV